MDSGRIIQECLQQMFKLVVRLSQWCGQTVPYSRGVK